MPPNGAHNHPGVRRLAESAFVAQRAVALRICAAEELREHQSYDQMPSAFATSQARSNFSIEDAESA